MIDEIDNTILTILQREGRLSNADLARRIGLSPPATHTRLHRLEDIGLIASYAALLDREKAGFDMLVFIHLSLQRHQPDVVESVHAAIRRMPEVLECHHVTGDYDLLLKVVIRNRKDLERFVVERLTAVPGLARIQTSLVLTEVKSTTALPLQPQD